MSKIKDELIGAESAVRDVADLALRRIENIALLCKSFPALENHVGNETARFVQAVKNILVEKNHPESDNSFIGQVAYHYLIEDGRPDDLDFDEEIRRDGIHE